MKTKIRMVEVEGGKYAVQKMVLFMWRFTCNSGDGYVWSKNSIHQHCIMDTEERALACYNKLKERLQMENRKKPKVLRVFITETV